MTNTHHLPLASLAVLVLLGTAGAASAQDSTRAGPPADRICRGAVISLAWDAYVRDAEGRCTPERTAKRDRPAVGTRRPTVIIARADACPVERRWLGGAVQLCRDVPGTEARR
jgi:hypothetical protein